MNTLKKDIIEILEAAVRTALHSEAALIPPDFTVRLEYARVASAGDYAVTTALELAKPLKDNPMKIAERIVAALNDRDGMFKQVTIAPPGFINITLAADFLHDMLENILDEKEHYGISPVSNEERILVEFVSANPTGPLNIVSARAAAVGDTLARILSAVGYHVRKEYYINDYGNQARLLGESVYAQVQTLRGNPTPVPDDGYHGEYIRDIAESLLAEKADMLTVCEKHADYISVCADYAIDMNVEQQKNVLARYGVVYDSWFSERRSLHEIGKVDDAFAFLQKNDLLYEEEGAFFFKSSEYDDEKDRVVRRADGRPTYYMADIAYHIHKYHQGYDRLINIIGPDHHGYIARLTGAMHALGHPRESLEMIICQQVNLLEDGQKVKMSKRAGKLTTMEALLDEVGSDAARYFFCMRSISSHLDFDLALAKKKSDDNPLFYVQYAHARICSIFRQAAERGIRLPEKGDLSLLTAPEELNLIKRLCALPDEIVTAADNRQPHIIPTYLESLAADFHKFYTECIVISEDTALTTARLLLCRGAQIVIANTLKLMGVSAPEHM